MKIKSKFIIIMITCFALISCMTIISAADVPNGNHTDTQSNVFKAHSTNNEPVMAQNTEIKTSNTKNNNIQRNNQMNNQNNDKFQNQQSKSNPMEIQSLSENQNQPKKPTLNNTQTTRPQQDQNNIPTNMTPKFNDNTLPEIQQPRNNDFSEKQNQPRDIQKNNFNKSTMPQQLVQNFNNNIPGEMSNMTPKFEDKMFDFQDKNTSDLPKHDMNQQIDNKNNMSFDFNNNALPQKPQENFNNNIPGVMSNMNPKFEDKMFDFQDKNTSDLPKHDMNQQIDNKNNIAFDFNKNQKPQQPQQPQQNLNKNIPQALTHTNQIFNNNQKSNIPREKINPKQNINNHILPKNNRKPVEMKNSMVPGGNGKPMGNFMNSVNNSRPVGMNNSMVPGDNGKPMDTSNTPSNNNMDHSQTSDVTYSTNVDGQLLVSGTTTTKNNNKYTVTNSESNTVLVQNGGTLKLSNSKITKTGDTTNSGNSEFLGTNAAVLTTYGSTAYIMNSTIVTDASGANAIFATNTDSSHSGATIYVNDTTIDTYQDKSRGLDATYGGTIIANNVTINTRGGSCAALATDRGEGTVKVSNSILNTGVDNGTGQGSPCIYSTGAITVINSTGTANGAQIACIEGKNSINLINSTLYCSGEGNRQENGNYVDLAGVFIYQSMSGDADVGTAQFTSTNSNLSILSTSDYYKTAPMFYVTNTKGIVSITNTTLNFGSGVLIKVSNQNQWGTTGSNGGDLTFNAINESLNGKVIVGDYSSLSLNLKNSTYKGAITTSNSATSSITIEKGSTWTLTGDSYLTSLTNHGTIICGDYKLYVNGVEYTI